MAERGFGAAFTPALARRDDILALACTAGSDLRAMDGVLGEATSGPPARSGGDFAQGDRRGCLPGGFKLVHSTLFDALTAGASDIHLENDAQGIVIKYASTRAHLIGAVFRPRDGRAVISR